MDGPVLHDAGLAIDNDRILAVAPQSTLHRLYPDSPVLDLGDSVILPGLINAHTHLELTLVTSPDPPPASLVPWLINVIQQTSNYLEATAANAAAGAAAASLSFGVTCAADITRLPHLTRPALRDGPLRIVSFGEVTAMGARRHLLDARLTRALDTSHNSSRLSIGISPHAPYSIEPAGYARCLDAARQHDLPLMTHLAESPHEAEFLSAHTGPFLDLWNTIGGLDDQVPTFPGGPIRLAHSLGLLDYPKTLLAHVNYCGDEELDLLSAGRASVVYCPRTHAHFQHPPHRWLDMLARGINVAVGTDSTLSSHNLNLVEDLRLLHRLHPDVSPLQLWQLITTRASMALGLSDQLGSLSPGKLADFVVFPSPSDDPLSNLLITPKLPSQVWISGTRVL